MEEKSSRHSSSQSVGSLKSGSPSVAGYLTALLASNPAFADLAELYKGGAVKAGDLLVKKVA